MSQMPVEQLTYAIKFYHPEKILAKMPGINNEATLAAILGVDIELYRQILREFFTVSAHEAAPNLLLSDGIHPSLAGQQAIVTALVKKLATI
ncbi:hypothetical protein PN499_18370 [Kamptonema animale CS-326]|jgi:lysophospholipase L1-like esterase|uniref:hypothetical protein n=1 Tax=Kamptonema animale TaxID=92934 RepID=UPI00232C3C8C|nr:hypothetical protein [Kamptonema animale]MDB9513162.1 hypothetical protein [Kamptonema animale CS-326]